MSEIDERIERINIELKRKEEIWIDERREIALFIKQLEYELGIFILRPIGLIFDDEARKGGESELDNIILTFKLNNDILEVDQIFFDDRQLIVRENTTKRMRRINMRTIKEIYYDSKKFTHSQ